MPSILLAHDHIPRTGKRQPVSTSRIQLSPEFGFISISWESLTFIFRLFCRLLQGRIMATTWLTTRGFLPTLAEKMPLWPYLKVFIEQTWD